MTEQEADYLVELMTDLLKKPGGAMRLRRAQAVALYELGQLGGLLGPITVGGGKTLVSLLGPVVCESARPLLIVPAKFVEKTLRDWRALAEHWRIPEFIQLKSYEWLGRVQAASFLEEFQPDFVGCDEVHRLKNTSAAVTRRFRRFAAAHPHPEVKYAMLSGTLVNRSLHEYHHVAKAALPAELFPMPDKYEDLVMWAGALDEDKDNEAPCRPGMLKALCVNADGSLNQDELRLWEKDEVRAARLAFRRRLTETPGVVAAFSDDVGATIAIEAVEPAFRTTAPGGVSPVAAARHRTARGSATPAGAPWLTPEDGVAIRTIDEAFTYLRGKWRTPDGWPIGDGITMFRHARELAVGFWYRWEPRPPREWLEPRKKWCKFVRETLKHSRKLDSELAVANAFPDCDELVAWRAVRDTFKPNTVAVWLDDSVLEFATEWAESEPGIVWVEHKCVGERLAEHYGLTYYGAQGLDARGRLVDDHPATESFVASIQSSGEGRNLQKWSRNLVLGFPPNGRGAEQLIGRTHRPGQREDDVTFDVLVTCYEHAQGFWQAHADAEFARDSTGAPQKILLASVGVPSIDAVTARGGETKGRWVK